jgi:alpha-amylase
MSSICLCLHLHQPFVLRHYSVFDTDIHYFDGYKSRDACRRFAARSILPTNTILAGLLRRSGGRLRISCAITGTALDLFSRYAPEVIDSFHELNATGCVEFLGTPYHHGLSIIYSPTAFREQVEAHRQRIAALFDRPVSVLRNSELVYGDLVADVAAELGFSGVMADGLADVLAARSCSRVYLGGQSRLPLLLRNERLSRDVSERFADRAWDQWPLTAPRYAEWLSRFDSGEEIVCISWDYATFGLDIPADAGIFDFLKHLPERVLAHSHLDFVTASEALARYRPVDRYQPPHFVSTAERNGLLSAWLGNPMQSHAMHRVFSMEEAVVESGDPAVMEDWQRLQACEYFEAMSTMTPERHRLGAWLIRAESPYDAYINLMNICDSIAARVGLPVPA